MTIELTDTQARIIGCLMEKSVTTPDQYPLSVNALTNACNQKSSRDPVMNLSSGEVQHEVQALQDKHLVVCEENFKSQTQKYTHRLCNTPFSDYQFDTAQFATICVLLLRGPRTPGEIRANSGRLHTFADNEAVLETLQSLQSYAGGALTTELARTPGRKDAEYRECLSEHSGDSGESFVPVEQPARESNLSAQTLADRVTLLEREVAELKQLLANYK